ncbi:deazaflavin-dependent oxidoreductase (nitroreductase family) [Jatrophihabitans sp. GAS493]|uniref:nitroreductase/quinone reductase family protein n=1 Tax=Jatrophihabitans sp. GAS493 TaxID=1907575 RepID=UPI000BB947B4|nr:nitroreductase/quinone reductase family protein [Jatrophihabitans sp. GAS493]SOD72547.1 deazaflavin-dependent oxidoreductase (nitroreductase family) [Jatrophihabitans sp. GAS493]
MSSTEHSEYRPSASERARDQVARYEASDGTDGGDLDGRPVIILTTRGATSAALRKTPIMRVVDGDSYIAVASYAGNPSNPAWYHNLITYPDAEIRDGARRIPVHAREVSGDEKVRLWTIADAGNPAYARYRAAAGREIPVLLLEPKPPAGRIA